MASTMHYHISPSESQFCEGVWQSSTSAHSELQSNNEKGIKRGAASHMAAIPTGVKRKEQKISAVNTAGATVFWNAHPIQYAICSES